ncbi:hypothetical protein HPP92_021038 [Vanilla planifolia]|uniref:Uncharacterized protein n=1 Tax=Vanilla planifolia TaxID=51239 RepID=A0A835UI53_VANPL|nr:hypothetical protein HPP92_021038 [Vanilla planifolia]
MAGGNFLGRIISYVVNELVVEGLANNPSFQRFAVRTSKTLQDLSTKAEQTKQELTEQIREASKNFDPTQGGSSGPSLPQNPSFLLLSLSSAISAAATL